jgi:NarL family two-component system response regulator LiaR
MDEETIRLIKVFIIDDNIAARSILTRLIKGEADIEVIGEAGTGQGGIIMLGDLFPDVVLLEAAVGGGMHLSDILKEIHAIAPDSKVILCTDYTHEGLIPEVTEYGFYDFVKKPFIKNTLLRAIRNAVKPPETEEEEEDADDVGAADRKTYESAAYTPSGEGSV